MSMEMETETLEYRCVRNDCTMYYVLVKLPSNSIKPHVTMRCELCKTPLKLLTY